MTISLFKANQTILTDKEELEYQKKIRKMGTPDLIPLAILLSQLIGESFNQRRNIIVNELDKRDAL